MPKTKKPPKYPCKLEESVDDICYSPDKFKLEGEEKTKDKTQSFNIYIEECPERKFSFKLSDDHFIYAISGFVTNILRSLLQNIADVAGVIEKCLDTFGIICGNCVMFIYQLGSMFPLLIMALLYKLRCLNTCNILNGAISCIIFIIVAFLIIKIFFLDSIMTALGYTKDSKYRARLFLYTSTLGQRARVRSTEVIIESTWNLPIEFSTTTDFSDWNSNTEEETYVQLVINKTESFEDYKKSNTEKLDQNDKTDKVNQNHKIDKVDQNDKIDLIDTIHQTDKIDKGDQNNKTDKVDHIDVENISKNITYLKTNKTLEIYQTDKITELNKMNETIITERVTENVEVILVNDLQPGDQNLVDIPVVDAWKDHIKPNTVLNSRQKSINPQSVGQKITGALPRDRSIPKEDYENEFKELSSMKYTNYLKLLRTSYPKLDPTTKKKMMLDRLEDILRNKSWIIKQTPTNTPPYSTIENLLFSRKTKVAIKSTTSRPLQVTFFEPIDGRKVIDKFRPLGDYDKPAKKWYSQRSTQSTPTPTSDKYERTSTDMKIITYQAYVLTTTPREQLLRKSFGDLQLDRY